MRVGRDGGPRKRSKGNHGVGRKKGKPVRRDGYTARKALKELDLSFVDDMDRDRRGSRGFPKSALIKALLLMYLKGMDSLLELERFLRRHRSWVRFLGLRRIVRGREVYKAPHRTTLHKLVGRMGVEGMVEVFTLLVTRMVERGIIQGESVSLDATIMAAWFKDRRGKRGRLRKSRDRDASLGYDSYREAFVYGYKVHVLMDVETGLPICVSVTRAGYGEGRTLIPFLEVIHTRYPLRVSRFLADSAYDGNLNRLEIVRKLKAVPYIDLNPRNCKGRDEEERRARRRKLAERFYKREWIHDHWVDPQGQEFREAYDARTYSEQAFSIMRESLNLDGFRHRGLVWATAHAVLICMTMLLVANAAVAVGRPDLMRCIKCFRL